MNFPAGNLERVHSFEPERSPDLERGPFGHDPVVLETSPVSLSLPFVGGTSLSGGRNNAEFPVPTLPLQPSWNGFRFLGF